MNRRVAVRGIFVHDGKLLCVWHKPYNNHEVDYWCTIGGGVDPGESLINSLEREIVEETGIKPTVGKLIYIQQFIDKTNNEQMELFYHIENPEDYLEVDLSITTHGKDEIEKIEYLDVSKNRVLPEFLQEINFTNFDPAADIKYLNYL